MLTLNRPSTAALCLFLLAGCSTAPVKNTAQTDLLPVGEETVFTAEAGQDTRQPGRQPRGFSQPVLYHMLLGELAGHRGNLQIAVDNYMALARELREPRVSERAAKIAVYARRDAEALEAATLWVKQDPENVEARHVKAAMLMRSGDVEAAVAEFLTVLKGSPEESAQRLRMIVGFLDREEDKTAAMSIMRRLVEARPEDDDARFSYAVLALRAGQAETARSTLEALLEGDEVPDDTTVTTYLAVLQQMGRIAEAEAWLAAQTRQHPESVELRISYARLLADQKRYPEARVQFESAARRAPDNADVLFALGLLNIEEGRKTQAEAAFRKLAAGEERRDEALLYLGQLAEEQNEPDAALAHYAKIDDPAARFDAGLRSALILAQKKKDLPAAQALIQGLPAETEEQRNQLVSFEAELLVEAGKLNEAMQVYDGGLADNRYDSDLLYGRAMLAERMGRLDILEQDLRRIIEREPKHAQALNALGYTLADRTDRLAEAEGYIRQALEVAPRDFYILDSMGWVLFRMGRHAEAVEFLRQAQAVRNDPEVAAHLTEVLWTMGDRQGARSVWEAALKTTPGDTKLLETQKRLGITP